MIKKRFFLVVHIALLFIIVSVKATNSIVETDLLYLSGTGKDNMVNWDFYCSEGMNSGKWTKIGVPSCWELQGFGTYNYGHDKFESRVNEYGLYKHTFKIPDSWQNKTVKIVFEGVMTDAEVKVNGKLAGEKHQGAFYEFKYDITNLLHPKKDNVLEVKVDKASSNESINWAERKADFWIFGGIYRPVYLHAFPKQHIKRMAIDAQASGDIHADVFLEAGSVKDINISLLDLAGAKIQDLELSEIEKHTDKWTISTHANDIETWNPEQPILYQLAVSLIDKKGNILHREYQRIGFRTVEVLESDGIYVNGQKIKFKGVNRHSFYPESGRTTSKALSIEHVKMMKDMNMNAVRMSHYPPDVHFLDVCDSLGLFVIDEVCTWQKPALDTEIGKKIVKETVVRDVNHPSIVLWANGNEGGSNSNLDDDYALWDIQKREVIHPWGVFRKTNTLHYLNFNTLAYDHYLKEKIFFPTEFLHGLYDGGLGSGLEDYWNRMYHMPTCAGGFLWCFADEGVVRTDKRNKLDTDGNHAADGIVGPYGEKEASYYAIKEIWSPVYIEDRYIQDRFNGRFVIENRYHFTNLKECQLKASWVNFRGPHENTQVQILKESFVELPDLQPGWRGLFEISLPYNWKEADALYLKVTDPHGMEVFTWTYPVKAPKILNKKFISYSGKDVIKTQTKDSLIFISTNEVQFVFSNQSGLLKQVVKNGTVIPLADGMLASNKQYEKDTFAVKVFEEKVELRVQYKNNNRFLWTIHSNGLVDFQAKLAPEKTLKDYYGVSFSFPEFQIDGMKCLGEGPYRVWRNRMRGTRFMVWENEYNKTITGEALYDYPEFKGFYANLRWAKIVGLNNNSFTVYCHTPHVFFRILTPEQPSAPQKGATVKEFPSGDISFVKNIPGIGTKFKSSEELGLQGENSQTVGHVNNPGEINLTFEF